MAVIQVFSRDRPALTLSEVARLTGTTRATARRILLTLEELGHVRCHGRLFSLTPRVLTLGWAYLSSLNLTEVAQPLLEELVAATGESSSIATLDPPDVVFVARAAAQHLVAVSLDVGARLPAPPTALGRVLLAALPPEELDRHLGEAPLEALTEHTITDPLEFRAALADVRRQGWALVDEELEIGLRAVAAPITRPPCGTIAAVGVAAAAPRVSVGELLDDVLPAVLRTAEAISARISDAVPGSRTVPATDGERAFIGA